MKIACIGGGPAGLYFGILMRGADPTCTVDVFERNRCDDTFGFGVVFSDATLDRLAAADPVTHREIADRFARWDDIETHIGSTTLRSTGHGFCGIERKQLLLILQRRAQELGVQIHFEREIKSLDEVNGYDLVLACDGVSSWVRDRLASELMPSVDVRPNKFVWLGCTVPYEAFTFIFKSTPVGLFRVHAYRFQPQGSTFIAECTEETWRRAGFKTADEDGTIAILERLFAEELGPHRLIKNRSIWRNFPVVRCQRWHAGNVVIVGDAAHTAHFSIGSGTKLAMEDCIALRDALVEHRDVAAALEHYEAAHRPAVDALQAAAQCSLEWFENTERYLNMSPSQFGYHLMTRSLRMSHASVHKRDPALARAVEQDLAKRAGFSGVEAVRPIALPLRVAGVRLSSRVLAEGPVEADLGDVEVAMTLPPTVVATAVPGEGMSGPGVVVSVSSAADAAHALRILRRMPGDGPILIAKIDDHCAPALEVARVLAADPATIVWVDANHGDHQAVLLADRVRNETGVITAVTVRRGVVDADALIAAGRADLVVVSALSDLERSRAGK
jgi:anthraniloyl-CoA monooxygenase